MLEARIETIQEVCAVGSFLYVLNGNVEIISSEQRPLLAFAAINGGLVFEFLHDATQGHFLKDVTSDARGNEM